jgi:hypothetical protein
MSVSGKTCPKDVAAFVETVMACDHFQSESFDLDDVSRKEFLEKTIRELRCEDLKTQYEALRQKYRKNSTILRFLNMHGSLS